MLDYFSTNPYKKFIYATFFISSIVLMFIYNVSFLKCSIFVLKTNESTASLGNGSDYLVYSSKCHIPNLDPFSPEARRFYRPEKYKNCSKYELLSYIRKIDNTAILHINNDIVPSYTRNGVNCCYSNIVREFDAKNPDDHINISKCVEFINSTVVDEESIMVHCKDAKTNKDVYVNTHAVVRVKEEFYTKLDNIKQNLSDIFNVLVVGIDSVSRLNFIRSLPHTYKYLKDNNWLTLNGYNKIGDNTFPNLMAILTGFNESHAYRVCNPRKTNNLDNCPLLWYDYRKLGYITAYAEDEASISTFNYHKKGFTEPPTDFYLRSYMKASEKLKIVKKYQMSYCTGPEVSGERILNLAKDFTQTFQNLPNFGFFWMNSFSHNELNSVSCMDMNIYKFLSELTDSGALNNTIVIFLSDHGVRFGPIRVTFTGWLEERLPFIYFLIPQRFQMKYPEYYQNLKDNSYKLTTPYDLHLTLQHILQLSGFNYTVKPSAACPLCDSLFHQLPQQRSCREAGIEQHWCTCQSYNIIKSNDQTVMDSIEFAIEEIHQIVKNESRCAKYKLDKVISSYISSRFNANDHLYILVVFETKPQAVFESTVKIPSAKDKNFHLNGSISRLDSYSAHSRCVNDTFVKKYCYCR